MRNRISAALSRLRPENGQVIIFAAIGLTVMLGFVALAADVGMILHQRRVMQTAADSAAIAAAAEGTTAAAQQDALLNGVPTADVTVHTPPSSGPHTGAAANGYVEVIVSESQPTLFMTLFGKSSMTVGARAVASNVPQPGCVVTLGSTSPGVTLSGSANLTLTSCGVYDDATGAGALTMGGGTTLNASFISVVGTTSIHNGGVTENNSLQTLTPSTGAANDPDPLSAIVTAPPASDYASGCTAQSFGTGNFTIGPSTPTGYVCYSSFTVSKGSPNITLNPGLYIITGTMSIGSGGTLAGNGVTFYFVNSGSFTISNGVAVNLSAPTTGSYKGLLFYQDPGDTNADSFIGGNTGTTNGIFYLPKAQLTLANGTSATFNTDLVVGSLVMSGAASLNPYTPLTGSSPLSTPRLVE